MHCTNNNCILNSLSEQYENSLRAGEQHLTELKWEPEQNMLRAFVTIYIWLI